MPSTKPAISTSKSIRQVRHDYCLENPCLHLPITSFTFMCPEASFERTCCEFLPGISVLEIALLEKKQHSNFHVNKLCCISFYATRWIWNLQSGYNIRLITQLHFKLVSSGIPFINFHFFHEIFCLLLDSKIEGLGYKIPLKLLKSVKIAEGNYFFSRRQVVTTIHSFEFIIKTMPLVEFIRIVHI